MMDSGLSAAGPVIQRVRGPLDQGYEKRLVSVR